MQLLLPLSSVLGFPLYKETTNGRAATHQLYSFNIEIWFDANGGNEYLIDFANGEQTFPCCTLGWVWLTLRARQISL